MEEGIQAWRIVGQLAGRTKHAGMSFVLAGVNRLDQDEQFQSRLEDRHHHHLSQRTAVLYTRKSNSLGSPLSFSTEAVWESEETA